MRRRSPAARLLAACLALAVTGLALPVRAAMTTRTLTGTIVSAESYEPLSGVRLHAGDPRTGTIFSSPRTKQDGSFVIEGLPEATYELAVESGDRLYLVQAPLQVDGTMTRPLTLAVNTSAEVDGGSLAPAVSYGGSGGLWDKNWFKAVVIGGGAVLLLLLLDDDDDSRSTVSDPLPSD